MGDALCAWWGWNRPASPFAPVDPTATQPNSDKQRKLFPHEQTHRTNTKGKQVAVVIGATSKWQSDGRNTLLAHGKPLDDSALPVGVRWGVGGALAQKFARESFSPC